MSVDFLTSARKAEDGTVASDSGTCPDIEKDKVSRFVESHDVFYLQVTNANILSLILIFPQFCGVYVASIGDIDNPGYILNLGFTECSTGAKSSQAPERE